MLNTLIKKYLYSLAVLALVFNSGSAVYADDTEIYFTGQGADEAVRPNIIFILDTSGSMSATVSGTGGQSRLEVMKDAVKQVITDVEDVNIGLMRFTSGSGGPVLFPVTGLESDVNTVESEATVGTFDYETSITDGINDVEMNIDDSNAMYLSQSIIEVDQINTTISTIPTTASFEQRLTSNNRDAEEKVGGGDDGDVDDDSGDLDFRPNSIVSTLFEVNIPDNAKITDAYIQFRVDNQRTTTTNITIYGEDSDDASFFDECNDGCKDISSRTRTSASVAWNGVAASSAGAAVNTPDIKTIVQEIVSRGCADPSDPTNTTNCTYENDEMNFIFITSTGNRDFESRNGSSSRAPKLFIEYESGTTTATNSDTQIAGLRFENIRIPQGATITDASLIFTPTSTVTTTAEWRITAEDVDNSAEFTSADGNISVGTRTRTSAVAEWDIGTGDWATDADGGVAIETSDQGGNTPLKNVIQEVVNRPGWCGGNSLSLFITGDDDVNKVRGFESFESSADNTVRLKYSYTSSGGCFENIETSQAGIGNDDAEQAASVVNTIDTDLNIGQASDVGQSQTVGLRFQGIDVPQGSSIIEARLLFYAQGTSTGTANFTIKGIDVDDVVSFSATTDDITNRPATTASVAWAPEDWTTTGELYESADISTVVAEIVARPGWASGNNMGFIIEPGTGERIADSYNGDPARGPRLRLRYADTVSLPFKSVRETLIEIVDDLPASGLTPIQETLYEAARYWRGESMEYGDSRAGARRARISHPGSYCTSPGNCRGAKENEGGGTPTDEYGVYTPSSCNIATNPSSSNCSSQVIEHDDNSNEARYISPFSSDLTCANNYQVLLTDGSANGGNNDSPEIKALTGKSTCFANNSTFKTSDDIDRTYPSSEDCTVDLAQYMATVDQSTSSVGENLANDQLVKTYTIGFNLDNAGATQFIKDIANLGEGQFYEASTAGQLVDVFTTILTDVKSDPTSFVSPSLATNAFNRLLSRDEVYFGLFTPELSSSWYGNMKKYNICVDTADGCSLGAILDATSANAIDDTDNRFKDTAQSIWSDSVDGRATTQGGAGAEITDYTNQILYTDKGVPGFPVSGALLSASGLKMTSSNWDDAALAALRAGVCPTPSTTGGSECEERMHWLLGKKVITDASNDVNVNQRWSVNDVLHSSPSVITYGGADTDNDGITETFFDKIVYGTNDGTLHFVNGTTGVEEWRYLPSDFWQQQQTQYLDAQGDHTYGIDITPAIWQVDNNFNGTIEPGLGDFVKVFLATRRGGNYLYALDLTATVGDITDTVIPRFLWRKQGGVDVGYERLGQTWSQPQIAQISVKSGATTTSKDVLIFGGGYDTALDDPNVYTPADNSGNDFLGNAVYIADPNDGSVIVSISGSGSGADIEVPEMSYSIPSRIRVVDSDGDSLIDRLYFGDTGGQIWRVDLAADIDTTGTSPTPESTTVVGRLASISDTTDDTKKRRFFEPPSVVQVRDTVYSDTAEYDYVLIGSGFRPSPLNTEVLDQFYAFRDTFIDANSLPDADGDNIAEATDGYPSAGGIPITTTTMVDATTRALDATNASDLAGDGWYYDFTASGNTAEKVLSAPTTTAGIVTFTTFRPSAVSITDPCQGGVGNANAYNFNILSANGALDWDGDGDIDLADRALALGGGIPSDVVPVFTKEGVVGIVGIEGGASQLGKLAGLPRYRTYWYEE